MRWNALAALVVVGENSAVLKHRRWKGVIFLLGVAIECHCGYMRVLGV